MSSALPPATSVRSVLKYVEYETTWVCTSMSGCARLNAANDCRYAEATCSSHSRTVTTVLPPGGLAETSNSTAVATSNAATSTNASAKSVENLGRRLISAP